MQDNTLEVRPRDFVNATLDPGDRAPFMEALREAGIDPNVAFEKDISLVKVNRFKMVFESGMVLVGKRDDLSERVRIRSDDSEPGVEIEDTIKRLSGRCRMEKGP